MHELFCLCEADQAQKLLNPAKKNLDYVFMEIVLCYDHGVEVIYAADIHCHNKCYQNYFREYDESI